MAVRRRVGLSFIVASVLVAVAVVGIGGAPQGAAGVAAAGPRPEFTQTVTLFPSKDNTLYETELGTVSNGKGQHLFAGSTNDGDARRAVLAFDVAGTLPTGATVTAAALTLTVSRAQTGAPAAPMSVHPLQRSWGEGASDALGEEGAGATAQPGDATWLYTFFNSTLWTQPGGDFGAALAATPVGGPGAYTWSSAALTAGVQAALDAPTGTFGWIVIGDESAMGTARRFDSREHPAQDNRPRLVVTYTTEGAQAFIPVAIR